MGKHQNDHSSKRRHSDSKLKAVKKSHHSYSSPNSASSSDSSSNEDQQQLMLMSDFTAPMPSFNKKAIAQRDIDSNKLEELTVKVDELSQSYQQKIAHLETELSKHQNSLAEITAKERNWVQTVISYSVEKCDSIEQSLKVFDQNYQELKTKVDTIEKQLNKHLEASCTMIKLLPKDFARKEKVDDIKSEINAIKQFIRSDQTQRTTNASACYELRERMTKLEKMLSSNENQLGKPAKTDQSKPATGLTTPNGPPQPGPGSSAFKAYENNTFHPKLFPTLSNTQTLKYTPYGFPIHPQPFMNNITSAFPKPLPGITTGIPIKGNPNMTTAAYLHQKLMTGPIPGLPPHQPVPGLIPSLQNPFSLHPNIPPHLLQPPLYSPNMENLLKLKKPEVEKSDLPGNEKDQDEQK